MRLFPTVAFAVDGCVAEGDLAVNASKIGVAFQTQFQEVLIVKNEGFHEGLQVAILVEKAVEHLGH